MMKWSLRMWLFGLGLGLLSRLCCGGGEECRRPMVTCTEQSVSCLR